MPLGVMPKLFRRNRGERHYFHVVRTSYNFRNSWRMTTARNFVFTFLHCSDIANTRDSWRTFCLRISESIANSVKYRWARAAQFRAVNLGNKLKYRGSPTTRTNDSQVSVNIKVPAREARGKIWDLMPKRYLKSIKNG